MKKLLATAIILVFCTAAGIFAYRYANPVSQKSTTASQAESSAVIPSSGASSQTALKADAVSGEADKMLSAADAGNKSGKAQTDTDRIKAAVNLDWNKYVLKASQAKVLKGKTYSTYDIWVEGDGYIVGPRILVDQSSKSIFTWAPNDASPVPVAEDKAFDKTPHTITGTMKDGAHLSVILTTANGDITVLRLNIDTSKLKSLKIGDRIKVTYTGIINGTDTTRAFITKLENAS